MPELSAYEGYSRLLLAADEQIVIRYEIRDHLTAPVAEGEEIGKITYLLGDETVRECRITAGCGVEKIDFSWCLSRLMELLCIV